MGEHDPCCAPAGQRRNHAVADLASSGPVTVTVRGGCMAPKIPDGARVVVAPATRYWIGDVVAYRTRQGGLVLHRVLGYRRREGRWYLVTRGDRDRGVDGPVAPEQVIGRLERGVAPVGRVAAAGRFLVWAAGAMVRMARR